MKKVVIVVFILTSAIIFYGSAFYKDFLMRCEYFNSSICGRVNEIRFTEQKLVEIKLNNKEDWLYLGTNVIYKINIDIGDSIYKKSRNYEILLVKNGKKFNISSKRKAGKYLKYCRCNEY